MTPGEDRERVAEVAEPGAGRAEVDEPARDQAASDDVTGDRSWGWHLVRATGLVLVVGMPVLVARVLVAADVGQTTAATVGNRLAAPIWRVGEWVVMVLALLHAAVALDQRLRARTRRPTTSPRVLVGLVCAALVVVGTRAIVAVP